MASCFTQWSPVWRWTHKHANRYDIYHTLLFLKRILTTCILVIEVITLVLSIIIFILFLWFFVSPLFFNRSRPPPPRPIDVEDAYFVDENIRTRPPHIPGPLCASLNTYRAINTQKPTSPPLSVASPPPAYTSCPTSLTRTDGAFPFFSRLATSESTGSAHRGYQQHHRSFRNMFGAQNVLPRSFSAPLPISKPIPHPEHPLPGPDILAGSLVNSRKASGPETTILRPCAAPHAVSDSTLHPPAIYLPSQAVVHNVRDTLCRSFSEGGPRFPVGRFSARSGRRTISGQDISITSSKIGLAF